MTSDIFKTWLHDYDREILVKWRKVLMLVDNCPAHPVIQGLRAVELLFLPPNCTSVLQPMDQGIIRLFKFFYRKESLRMIVDYIDTHNKRPEEFLNILQALRFTKTAWNQVKPAAIENCFKHGFFGTSTPSELPVGDLAGLIRTISTQDPSGDMPTEGEWSTGVYFIFFSLWSCALLKYGKTTHYSKSRLSAFDIDTLSLHQQCSYIPTLIENGQINKHTDSLLKANTTATTSHGVLISFL